MLPREERKKENSVSAERFCSIATRFSFVYANVYDINLDKSLNAIYCN